MLGRLALKLETWDRSLNMHPGILDGAIQLLLLACPNFQQCFLPFSIDSCIIATTFPSWDLWVTVRVRSASAEAVSGDLEVSTDDGVLVARLSRLTCRAHRPESAQLSQFSQMTYHVAFVEMANRPSYALPQSVQRALVCCSKKYQERVLAALSWTAERCKFVEDAPSALSLLGSLAEFGTCGMLAGCINLCMETSARLRGLWVHCLPRRGGATGSPLHCSAGVADGSQVQHNRRAGCSGNSATRAGPEVRLIFMGHRVTTDDKPFILTSDKKLHSLARVPNVAGTV